jgi:hypothetical protein
VINLFTIVFNDGKQSVIDLVNGTATVSYAQIVPTF